MKTTSKLVLGMTLAMITAPTLAAGSMGNSTVWTTTNGSAIVDSSGNPIRTIHFVDNTVTVIKRAPSDSPSLLAVIKKAVAKVLHKETDPALEVESEDVITPESTPKPQEEKVVVTPAVVVPDAETAEVEATTKIIEEVPEVSKEVAAIVTPITTAKIEYRFNDYTATVLFDTDSATLTEDGTGSLTQLAMATANSESIVSVQVVGHADSRGDYGYNMTLSEERMNSVANFLEGLQLQPTSLFAKGETSPITGKDGENLTLSRRVQVAIKTRHIKD